MPHPTQLPFFWIDAFTRAAHGGNPCAVILDCPPLGDEQLLQLAREMNLSETAFVMTRASDGADFEARYFTPEKEIPLAGHPTIAVMQALLESKRLPPDKELVTIKLPAGVVQVSIQKKQKIPAFGMRQLKPVFMNKYPRDVIAKMLGLSEDVLLADLQPQTVSTGTAMLMIPLKNHQALSKAKLDSEIYQNLRENGDFFSPHLFCLQGISAEGDTFARHLGIAPDVLEDAFTGSATGCMGAYLWHYGLLKKREFNAEQGHWMNRPGVARVFCEGPLQSPEAVWVAGNAVTLIRGNIDVF